MRSKVTSHAQNVLGHACIFMHMLTQGSDPIVAPIMESTKKSGGPGATSALTPADSRLRT